MLAGHFAATATRRAASEGPILVLQDTTEFIYSRARPDRIGFTGTMNGGRYKAGQPNVVTLSGMHMHSSLAVTLAGTPLGLTAVKSGCHRVAIGGDADEAACLHVKFAVITTLSPIGKKKHYRPRVLTYIHALELDPPAGGSPIDWKLLTNLPVDDIAAAVEKLDWYALRWKAECSTR
ncbi:hypothetical protein [Mesorhizobium amorphae]|uniref:hypothetical protein n=1 Tax=Mesorhizobium amorphae TaxID=71433 RepID=UPI0002F14E87|nr:hypothetical protein [Mesorhizobium amorphae]ANT54509.1 hypothetical protein A6B35_31250 [Mesorhizobium amorphae CCNWGS0123]